MIQLDGWIEYDTVAFAGPILESKGVRATFQKKSKKGQNIWKFGQKYTKFVDILKRGNLIRICPALIFNLIIHDYFIY